MKTPTMGMSSTERKKRSVAAILTASSLPTDGSRQDAEFSLIKPMDLYQIRAM
jgi:hypothetical protein